MNQRILKSLCYLFDTGKSLISMKVSAAKRSNLAQGVREGLPESLRPEDVLEVSRQRGKLLQVIIK